MFVVCGGVGGAGFSVGRGDFLHLGVRRGLEFEHRAVHWAVGDFGGRQFDRRGGARGGVDGGAQGDAVGGIPGELGAGDQAAGFLRGDVHRVGGLTGDVGGCRAGDVHVAQMGDGFFDLGDAWGFVGGARRVRARAGAPGAIFVRGDRVAVERVRGRVVHRDGVSVVVDLCVALFGLQLEAQVPVLGDPQPPGPTVEQGAGGQLTGAAGIAAGCEIGAFEQVVAQLDARRDSLHGRGDERLMDRVG